MLTDFHLKRRKPKRKFYKVADRDAMYMLVQPSGKIAFRYDYRSNGWRETVTLGRYAPTDLSLPPARETLIDAKRAIGDPRRSGRSPHLSMARSTSR